MYFFIVDLDKTATNKVCFGNIVFCNCYDLTKSSWNDSFQLLIIRNTHHSVSLTTASLSIGKDGPIVSVKNAIDERKSALLINKGLGWFSPEHFIVTEAFGRFVIIVSDKIDLIIFKINFYYVNTTYNNSKRYLFLFLLHSLAYIGPWL